MLCAVGVVVQAGRVDVQMIFVHIVRVAEARIEGFYMDMLKIESILKPGVCVLPGMRVFGVVDRHPVGPDTDVAVRRSSFYACFFLRVERNLKHEILTFGKPGVVRPIVAEGNPVGDVVCADVNVVGRILHLLYIGRNTAEAGLPCCVDDPGSDGGIGLGWQAACQGSKQ